MKGFACLKKQETLKLFETGDEKNNDLILNDIDPFPGYYSETPGDNIAEKPKLVFLVLNRNEICNEDAILRISYNHKDELEYDFEANFGRLTLHNKTYPCIRILTEDLSMVPDLLEKFKSQGLVFEKAKEVKSYSSYIEVRKYIDLEKFDENVYKGSDANHYYLEVSKKLKWTDFVKLIMSIKGSREYKSFDAAQISFYLKDKIIEFVRIYTETFEKRDFIKLRNEIEKLQRGFL